MLKLENVSKKFNDTEVLKEISFTINKGEIVSLLGSSGSGKSTLLNLIAGFEQSDTGYITYNEKVMSNENIFIEAQNRNIGFVFQNYALFPHLNVQKNIAFGIEGKNKKQKESIVNKLLELINMTGSNDKYPHQLSGGQQQRVAIARVLARQSELILFDEAFSSIDSHLKLKLIKEIKQIIKSQNKTALFVTHDPKEAILISDKIAYLENGNLIQFDTALNLHNNPANNSIKELFGKDAYIFKSIDDLLV